MMDILKNVRGDKRVLVTGATGFIGSNLVRRLSHYGYNTHIITRPGSNLAIIKDMVHNTNVHIYDGSTQSILRIVESVRPDMVFHLATLYIAEHATADIIELVNSNILFGAQLLEAMKLYNINYLINAGTHWQHYNFEKYNPVNLYAATKQAFEDLAKYYSETTELRMITLKLLDTYGPNDSRPKLFSLLNRITQSGETLDMSEGHQQLGLVYIDDIVDAFLHTMKLLDDKPARYCQDFFAVPEDIYTLREVVSLYEQTTNVKLNINWGAKPYRNREMLQPCVGNKLPDWKAHTSLAAGIKLMIDAK